MPFVSCIPCNPVQLDLYDRVIACRRPCGQFLVTPCQRETASRATKRSANPSKYCNIGSMMQRLKVHSVSGRTRAQWRLLRCPAVGKPCRRLHVQSSRQADFIIQLPSAPPLRDDVADVERQPHQYSIGLEPSTSAYTASPSPHQDAPSKDWMDLGAIFQPKTTLLLGGLLGGLGFDTSKPSSVLQAMGVMALIVAVHEAGHFLAARLQGIRVTRFAVGFGPTLWKYDAGGVEYCLNAIPLGGYVAFPEDDDDMQQTPAAAAPSASLAAGAGSAASAATAAPSGQSSQAPTTTTTAATATTTTATVAAAAASAKQPAAAAPAQIRADDPDLLKNRPIPQRALVISAGVIANVLFAYLVLLAQICTVGKAETAFLPGVRVTVPDTPAGLASAAARAGLRTGDVILRVGDVTIPAAASQVSETVAAIRSSPGKELLVTVRRADAGSAAAVGTAAAEGSPSSSSSSSSSSGGEGSAAGEVLSLRCVPDAGADGQGRIGVQLTSNTYIMHTYPHGTLEVLAMTQSEFSRLSGTVLSGLKKIVTNFAAMSGQLSGPVAIVAAGSEVVRLDSAGLFQFAAIVNINLAAVNILPLPALDGGYLVLLGLEAARGGRKLPAGVEQGVMASGFLLLTALGLGLVIRDTINLL